MRKWKDGCCGIRNGQKKKGKNRLEIIRSFSNHYMVI